MSEKKQKEIEEREARMKAILAGVGEVTPPSPPVIVHP